jgi:hypothetical protein
MLPRRSVFVASLAGLVVLSAPGVSHARPAPEAPATAASSASPDSGSSGSPIPAVSPSVAIPESPPPFASPTATATPTPLLVPIVLDRAHVGVVPGATVTVGVSGGSGTLGVRASTASVNAVYDPIERRLSLGGRAPGRATVTVFDASGDATDLDVLVAPPAGVVPSDVSVELGGTVSPQFATAKIQAAIAAAAQLRPGSRVDVRGAQPGDSLAAGSTFEASARVHVDGANAYVDVDGTTNVHVRVETLAQLDPQILFYSDDPERLESGTDGVLYRNSLDATKPARAYVYHVASKSTHALYLVLRTTVPQTRVQLIGSTSGPSDAFGYVGHLSTLHYLLARGAQESNLVSLTPDAPFVEQLGGRDLRPGELVAGIFDARVLAGGPVDLSVVATSGGIDPLAYAGRPEIAGDGHGRRGEFDLTSVPPLALAFAAGAPDPPPFAIGAPTIANLRAGGRALGGDYGALREVSLQVSNPSADPATVYFYEVPAGGSATTTIWFAGDPKPTEIACVVRPNRYAIRAIALAPGETRDVTGEYMTDGTASFPLQFGLTSTPPSPPPGQYSPDACNPHTPPPATPAPSAIPSPADPIPAPTSTSTST